VRHSDSIAATRRSRSYRKPALSLARKPLVTVQLGHSFEAAPGASWRAAANSGGSQVGARALYRLNDRLALSARFYTPLDSSRGAEAAVGLEVQPLRQLPLRLVAERRQAIGADGGRHCARSLTAVSLGSRCSDR
jgi:hypothetical protein